MIEARVPSSKEQSSSNHWLGSQHPRGGGSIATATPKAQHLKVAMLLANPGNADARVQKEAESLAIAGHDVTVYCLAAPGLPLREMQGEVVYVRLAEPHRRLVTAKILAASPQSTARRTRTSVLAQLRQFAGSVLGAAKAAIAPFVMHELHAWTFVARVIADRPDIVHAHDFEVLPAAVRIARRCGASVVYDMHEYELGRLPVPGRLLAAWKRHIERRAVAAVSAAITVSPSVARLYAATHGRDEPTLILNAPVYREPSQEPKPSLREVLGLDACVPLAVQVGTSAPGRGVESLLAALTRLPRLHLALVGTVRPELAAVIERAQADPAIGDRLHVVPPVPHEQVVPFIASADVGICAVRPVCLNYEFCLPNKLFEMTLAGLPLVVSSTRDVARLVTQIGNGIVTDTGDPAALAAAITRALAERQALRPDPAKLAQLRRSYGWDAQARKLTELYRRLAEQRQAVTNAAHAVKRRILMINLIEWDRMCGGAQHQLGLFGAWRASGHTIRMLSPHPRNPGWTAPNALAGHLETFPSLRRWGLPAALDTLVQCGRLLGEQRRFRPDLVYSRHNALTPLLVLTCRMLGLPVFLEHNSWLPAQRRVDGGSAWLGWLEGVGQILATRWATGARSVTPGMARHLLFCGASAHRLTAIGNGTDTTLFHPMDREQAFARFNLDPERMTVGFIGNIMPWHGLETALEGFAAVAGMISNVDLVIFGDGPGVSDLKAEAELLGIGDRVFWKGRVPLDDANVAINCMDVALLPLSAKHDIGFGFSAIKLRDYAAAGRIVLTSRLPGAIELEDEPWLFTHAPDDSRDLGAKLTRLLIERALHPAAQRAARAYAEQHFDWTVIGANIERFIAERMQPRSLPLRLATGPVTLSEVGVEPGSNDHHDTERSQQVG